MEDTVYFAKLDTNNIVIEVISLNCKDCCDYLGEKLDNIGVGLLQQRHGANTLWKETFKTGARGNFAKVGYIYNEELDAFILPQPFPSWTLDTDTYTWVAPLTEPTTDENIYYMWDEDAYQADNTQGWKLPLTFQ